MQPLFIQKNLQLGTLRYLFPVYNKKKNASNETFFSLVAETGFEPRDLRVMSPTSYQAAPLRDILEVAMVPETGIEPVRDVSPTGF